MISRPAWSVTSKQHVGHPQRLGAAATSARNGLPGARSRWKVAKGLPFAASWMVALGRLVVTATPIRSGISGCLGRHLERDRRVEVRVLRRPDLLNRIPILAPRLRLAGLEKAEVGLVVGVNAGHDFDVGREFALRVGFGEVAVPRVAELVVAPRPLLLAGRDVVVGDVDDAGLRLVIVAAEEILLACPCTCRRSARGCWRRRTDRSARSREARRSQLGVRRVAGNAAARTAAALRPAGFLCVRARRSSRRSRSLRPADTRSSSGGRGRRRNRHPAGRSFDRLRARAWRRWPTRETSARRACGCRRAPSVRRKPGPDAGRRRACLSCGPSDRDRCTRWSSSRRRVPRSRNPPAGTSRADDAAAS